mmetsp:Transcript_27038/g.38324  ORF Transcript_27038/g.38324 Transcript_27038/m.38324 type:complete len:85 (+) Transcript_27038:1-255(+)
MRSPFGEQQIKTCCICRVISLAAKITAHMIGSPLPEVNPSTVKCVSVVDTVLFDFSPTCLNTFSLPTAPSFYVDVVLNLIYKII